MPRPGGDIGSGGCFWYLEDSLLVNRQLPGSVRLGRVSGSLTRLLVHELGVRTDALLDLVLLRTDEEGPGEGGLRVEGANMITGTRIAVWARAHRIELVALPALGGGIFVKAEEVDFLQWWRRW